MRDGFSGQQHRSGDEHGSPVGTYDGFTLGSILKGGRRRVTFGVVLDIGDFVVAGDVTARGTALPGYPIVDKEGGTPGAFRWRVVSRDGTTAVGLYKPLVDFAGAGATVPLTGFGYSLAMGAIEAVNSYGILGALAGGVTRAASGIAAAIFFGLINALLFKPRAKP